MKKFSPMMAGLLALMSIPGGKFGTDHFGIPGFAPGPPADDIIIPVDPLAGADAKRKQELNNAKIPDAKTRKRLGLLKPVHVPLATRRGYHRKTKARAEQK